MGTLCQDPTAKTTGGTAPSPDCRCGFASREPWDRPVRVGGLGGSCGVSFKRSNAEGWGAPGPRPRGRATVKPPYPALEGSGRSGQTRTKESEQTGGPGRGDFHARARSILFASSLLEKGGGTALGHLGLAAGHHLCGAELQIEEGGKGAISILCAPRRGGCLVALLTPPVMKAITSSPNLEGSMPASLASSIRSWATASVSFFRGYLNAAQPAVSG